MTCSWDEEQERVMPVKTLVQHFGVVADPRCSGKIEHRLTDILVIAVCAVIACAESWDDIALLYGRSKLNWLRTFLELPNGIPSHDTFRRVFMLIDPETFEAGFTAWAGSLMAGVEREGMAIDGKTSGARSIAGGSSRLCMSSALGRVPRALCWDSAAWMASRTRSPPSPNCWTSWSWGTPLSPWTPWDVRPRSPSGFWRAGAIIC